jgi:chemotaxis regulatin CheY-phosphate phosphatase CheZ
MKNKETLFSHWDTLMAEIIEIKKIRNDAEVTKKNLQKKKEKTIAISREGLIRYCEQTIKLCNSLVNLTG